MECTQILGESEEDSPEPSTRERRQVATLKTDGDSYPIFLGENRIGRDPKTCSIVIDNMALSSQHAVIEGLSCGSFLIYDLNSRNKTRIGKMSLTPQVRYQLKNGESLRFANVQCTFCVKESINLVHLSFDDDIEELKSDTKEEAADNTSACDESIFDVETQRPEIIEKPSKAIEEKAEGVFKMPQLVQNINTSVVSLDESVASNGDDIFDLPTQPFTFEEGTGIGIKEKLEESSKDHSSRVKRLDVDEKHEKEDIKENVEEKDKSMDDSDLDDLFAAATQAYPLESDKMEEDKKEDDGKKSCDSDGKTSDENILSSVYKEGNKKELHRGLQDKKDSGENEIFDLPTQAFTTEEEPHQVDKSGDVVVHKEPSSHTTIPMIADAGKVEKKDDMSESEEPRGMGDSDADSFSAPINKQEVKEKEKAEKNLDFSTEEDSDDGLFASLPHEEYEKSKETQVSAVSCQDEKDVAKMQGSSLVAEKDKQNERGKAREEEVSGNDDEDDETDPEDSFSHKIEEMESKSSHNTEKKNKVIDESCANSDKDANETPASPAKVNSDDDDTDLEDMCPPSVNKQLPSQKFTFRKANDRDRTKLGIVESCSSVSSAVTTSKFEGNYDDVKKVKAKVDESSRSDDSSFLIDATLEDESASTTENQPGSIVIMSDTEDELDDSSLNLKTLKERFNEKKLKTFPAEDPKEKAAKAEVNKGTSATQSVSTNKATNEEKEEKTSVDLKTSEAVKQKISEQIGADEEDEDDMSSFLTQAPPDFKTPQAVKVESVDESDVSLLETPAVSKEADKEDLSIVNQSLTPNVNIGADEENEDDMSSFLTQAPPDFKTPQATSKELSVDESDVSMLDTQPPPNTSLLETPKILKGSDEKDPSKLSSVSKVNTSADDEEEDDMSSFLTQAPPDFKTPQAISKEVSADESDISMLDTQPPPTLETPKILKGSDEKDPSKLSSVSKVNTSADDEEEDDMSSFLTQAPPDFETPQAFKKDSVDESDISLLETQAPPSPETPAVSKKADKDLNQPSALQVNTGEDENEEDMSSFLTEAPAEFKTPQAVKGKLADESDISLLETQAPPSIETPKVSNGNDKEDLAELSSVSKGNATADDEEEDDMSSFLTQAPPDFETPQAFKKDSVDESDISLLETQAPPSPETPAVSKKADKEDLSIVNQSSTSNVNIGEDEEEDDMSSFLTQAPPDFKTPQAIKVESVDESDVSMLETQAPPSPETPAVSKEADKEDLSKVDVNQSDVSTGKDEEGKDDIGSFLTQAPPYCKTSQTEKKGVKEKVDDESDISMLEKQPSPVAETPIVTKRTGKDDLGKLDEKNSSALNITAEEEDEDDMSSFLTQAPPEFKTPMAVKGDELTDDSDVSMLETQPAPSETYKESNENLDVQEERSKLETPSTTSRKDNITSAKEIKESNHEIKESKPVKDESLNEEDDLSTLETQLPPGFKESSGDDDGKEDMSSFLSAAPPEKELEGKEDSSPLDSSHPDTLKTLQESHESDEEDMSSFLTQAPPDFCTPKVSVKKESEEVQEYETPRGLDDKETDSECTPLDSVTIEKIKNSDSGTKIKDKESEEDDLEIMETQPAPTSVSQKSILTVKESVYPMSSNPGIEDVSSDEEDVSLLETQPAPIPEKVEVVNGKQEIINIFKQPSKVLKEVTPSRTLRKKLLQKNEKEARVSPFLKGSKTEESEDVEGNDDDSDIGSFLPDTPDLAMTLQESKWSMHSACKNLFNVDDSNVNDSELSQEISEDDVGVKSTEIEGIRGSTKPSEIIKETKELVEKKQPEVERRNPTRGNASKKLASEGSKSSGEPHTRTNRKQKELSINVEEISSLKKNTEDSPDLSSKRDEPLPKRKGLRDKRSKVVEAEENKGQSKENSEKEGSNRKASVRKRTETCPQEVAKSEVHSTADEPARKRGRPNKRHADNDAKAKASERLSAIAAKTTKNGESEVTDLEVKHVEIQEVTKGPDNKETVRKKRRLSSLMEEVSSEGNAAHKSQPDILTSSPRKRHLRGEDIEVQPPAKELRVRKKDNKSALSSKNEDSVPAHRLRGNPSKEDQPGKEALSLPTTTRKRKLELVKPESRSPSKTPESNVVEGVRRSVRERKPKRRFSSEERPKDDGTASNEESRRGKIARLNKKDESQEKDEAEPESVSQEAKTRKLDERKALGGTKRTRSSLENDEPEDLEVSPSDKRRRKGRSALEKSAVDESKTESKEHDNQKDERSRGTSRRVTRVSNLSEKSISDEKIAEEKCLEKELSPVKVTARGRRRSSKQNVPESTTHDIELERSSSKQDLNQQTLTTRGGRRSTRRLTSSEESVPVSSSVEVRLEATKIEHSKGQDNRRGGRNRGRKESDAVSEVTSSEIVTSSQKTGVESTIEEKTNTSSRRGRKGGSVNQTCAVDKEDKVSSSTSVNPKQENVAVGTDISYLKSSPVKGRMTAFSPRACTSRDSVLENTEQKAFRNRRQKGKSYSVLFTGLNEPKLDEMVQRLGGKVVESPQDCSILVTDRLRRTYKLLCVVARGIPIVTVQWLAQSSTIGRFLDPADFFISDKLTEKRFDFSLKTSLEKARDKPLLAGFSVIATPSVKPPPEEIKGIVTSAGGEYLPSLSALQHKMPSQLYVVSCKEDSTLWKNYLECGAKKRPSRSRSERGKGKSAKDGSNVRLVGVEGLLVSILRQKIDLDDKMFSLG